MDLRVPINVHLLIPGANMEANWPSNIFVNHKITACRSNISLLPYSCGRKYYSWLNYNKKKILQSNEWRLMKTRSFLLLLQYVDRANQISLFWCLRIWFKNSGIGDALIHFHSHAVLCFVSSIWPTWVKLASNGTPII